MARRPSRWNIRQYIYPGAYPDSDDGVDLSVSPDETDLEVMVDGVALRGWVVNPGQKRALIYFGGNGERLDWLVEELQEWFPKHTSYLVAYRGYGASEGTPSERALTTDALAVFKHVKTWHPRSVDVIGRSLGSGVAMQVAARCPVRRLVLVTPFDSMAAVVADHVRAVVAHYTSAAVADRLPRRLPVRAMLRDRWNSASVAHRVRAPVLVLYTGRDDLVLPARTDQLLQKLPADTEVLNLYRRSHETIGDDPAYWPTIAKFLAT
jgi:uncharacterized protein